MTGTRRPLDPTQPTPRQQAILAWITEHCLQHHAPPTLAQIAVGMGMAGRTGPLEQVRALRRKGLLAEGILRPIGVLYTCSRG
jgi:SOS-response transcriptional repressor LexA